MLSFTAAPDFEAPTDLNGDNAYVVVLSVSDGTDSVDQTVTITVTDAYEGRVIDGPCKVLASAATNPSRALQKVVIND